MIEAEICGLKGCRVEGLGFRILGLRVGGCSQSVVEGIIGGTTIRIKDW